ncbi:MAG: hypothetical protein HYW65_00985 [Candidatus Liptonbacteria bacterium]|nr:hypothetical protein [Candidatus Liptonbacteria bacterium]
MIIFLYGPDAYRRLQKKQAVVGEFLKKHSVLGLKHFDCTKEEILPALREFGASESLFDSQRLAVLESVWEIPAEPLKEWLKSIVEKKGVTVLLSEANATEGFEFMKKSPVVSEKFETLKDEEWEEFGKKEIKKRGVELAPSAEVLLLKAYEGDSWRLATELDRIAAFGKQVTRQDLEQLDVETTPEFFALVKRFSYGSSRERLAALEALLLSREPAQKIFYILSAMVPGAAGRFAAYDVAIKNGKLEYEEALADLALG